MLATELLPQLHAYLAQSDVAAALGLVSSTWHLAFLAQGEYNINYLLTRADGQREVVRVNVGSQIGQAGGAQIAYEAAALRLLAPEGVAPTLHYLDNTLTRIPFGLLVMDFLPGGPLRYSDPAHITAAAQTLARMHRVPAPPDGPFIRRQPLHDDLEEARGWLAPYLSYQRTPEPQRAFFAHLLARAEIQAVRDADRFGTPYALVHTDVQAHNFIVNDTSETSDSNLTCMLVDWERPLIDDPTYDLAHFLLPTTTRWKSGYLFSAVEREDFLASYCIARPDLDPTELRERLQVRWPFILLRAISWCASAWVEYTGPGRAIDNRDTLETIEEYLQIDELHALFASWLEPDTATP